MQVYADDLDADELNYTMNSVHTWASAHGARRVVGKGHKAGSPKVLTPHIDSLAEDGLYLIGFMLMEQSAHQSILSFDRKICDARH